MQHNTFAFASELTSLAAHPYTLTHVSLRSLKKYFAYGYIPAPNTYYRNIHKLPGGHNMIFDISEFSYKIWKYWDFVIDPFESIPRHPEKEWCERLRELLENAVKRRLMSDVPLGVFLSGGIDSSAITAFASGIVGGERLKTFSIGFQEASFDESMYAQRIASLFKTEHYPELLSVEKSRDLLPEIKSRLDEPMGDSSILPTYLLCRETKKHVTVALGGDGGDELFAGYDPFRALRLAEIYKKLIPRPIHQGIRMVISFLPVSHRNMSLDFRLKRSIRGLSYPRCYWNPVWLGPLEPTDLDTLFKEPTDIEDIYSEAIECWETCSQDNAVDKTLQFYTKLYLQDDILVKTDRASMMNSLEVRAPFLDIDLIDFVRRIPWQYKYRRGQTKYILKKALESILPPECIYRVKKGFGVPIGKWFRDGSMNFEDGKYPDMLNSAFISQKEKHHRRGSTDQRAFLWNTWLLSDES